MQQFEKVTHRFVRSVLLCSCLCKKKSVEFIQRGAWPETRARRGNEVAKPTTSTYSESIAWQAYKVLFKAITTIQPSHQIGKQEISAWSQMQHAVTERQATARKYAAVMVRCELTIDGGLHACLNRAGSVRSTCSSEEPRKADMGVTAALRPVDQSGKNKRLPEPCIFVIFGASRRSDKA